MTIKIEDSAVSVKIIGIEKSYDLSVGTIIDYLSVDDSISKPESITHEQMLIEVGIKGNCYIGNPKMLLAMVYIVRFLNTFKDKPIDDPRFVGIADMIGSFTNNAIGYAIKIDSSLELDNVTRDDLVLSFINNDDMFKHKVLKKIGITSEKGFEVEDLPDYYVDLLLYFSGLRNSIKQHTTTVEDPSQLMPFTYKVSDNSIGNH